MSDVTLFLTLVMLLATAVSLAARSWWVADLLANLRIQLLLGLLAALTASVALGRNHLIALAAIGVALQMWILRSIFAMPPAAESSNLTVTTANVLSSNRDFEAIQSALLQADPDVVAILELSPQLQHFLGDQPGTFRTRYPYALEEPRCDNFGIGLYSKHPLRQERFEYFTSAQISSIAAAINVDNRSVTILATHPLPPIGAGNFADRNRHLQEVTRFLNQQRASATDAQFVVLGDLNITPWSPIFRDFCEQSKLQQANTGLQPTWYARPVFPLGLVLDHVLVTNEIRTLSYAVAEDAGSDHRFVTAALSIPSR